MTGIKKPSVAGQFYSSEKDELLHQLSEFKRKSVRGNDEARSRLVIAPHAGYVYSGQLMSESIHSLRDDLENIFIIAPAHRVPFIGLALTGYDAWQTPLGTIDVNQDLNKILIRELSAACFDEAFQPEHAAEVQVPFIQFRFGSGVKIVPVLVGRAVPGKVIEILNRFYDDPKNGFIISSDLSHFLPARQANELDAATARMIESGDVSRFRADQACDATGVCASVQFAAKRGWSFIRNALCNSGDVTGDRSQVVGYGSWFLFEGSAETFLKQHYSRYILETVRHNIESELNRGRPLTRGELGVIPAVMERDGACFVTLHLNGNLRGCIGSIQSRGPLIDDLLANSWNAAFGDPRFPPITQQEWKDISLDVSLLTPSWPIQFRTQEEMLAQIEPFRHGLIIADRGHRAVFLPSVWEQLPEKEAFLAHLKVKAGMPRDHFSPTFEARLFTSEMIQEHECQD
ncbi:MAG: AmmeMemoRadiSam system protein B [Planctomycetia bacterium]|nr:AmmeMemoRadiSam system protein B [Planctomycetia bacterium]